MNIFDHSDIIIVVGIFLDLSGVGCLVLVSKLCNQTLNTHHFWKLKYIYDYNYYNHVVDWKRTYLSIGDVYMFGLNHAAPHKMIMKAKKLDCGSVRIKQDVDDRITFNLNDKDVVIDNVKHFASGRDYHHVIYVDQYNNMYGVGKNNYNQVSPKNANFIKSSVKINVYIAVKDIACYNHNLILDEDGNVWSFGMNNYNQLGRDNNDHIPTKVAGLPKIIAIACGHNHSLVIDENNNVWGFGRNEYLGFDGYGKYDTIKPTMSGFKAKAIACGGSYSVFIGMDNNAYICGMFKPKGNYIKPTPLGIKAKKIACGKKHILFIDIDDNVWSLGSNKYGQLGINDIFDQTTPQPVNMKAREIYCGNKQSMILI